MNFKQKLKKMDSKEIWQEYCGFLDLSIEEYMVIQERLLLEQISLLDRCGLGQRIFGGNTPKTISDFLKSVPLTAYETYEDILLTKRADMLPAEPVAWLETTWESGSKPVKVAPYSEEMLSVYRNNILAALILSTSTGRGKFNVKSGARALYTLAPMPYATGLFPLLIDSEIDLTFMPSLKEAKKLSFSEQNKLGFKQAFRSGLDLFFGMSSIVFAITRNFDAYINGGGGSLKTLFRISPKMMYRMLKAKYVSRRDGTRILPRDLFDIDAFVCVGTDTTLFKEELEQAWGIRPMEIHGGTEPACLGTETWGRDGLVFFPDNAFYEFIPEHEMLLNLDDPSYTPRTYLINELVAHEVYELVITTFKGGAFVRYRTGDLYRCLRLTNEAEGILLPQFDYVDRVPSVIDIAGFTRITENSIRAVLKMSRLQVSDWFAIKEYDKENRSYMHIYVEMDPAFEGEAVTSRQVLMEHMSIYFRHYDHDYGDLKKMLGIEPLQVTVLTSGTIVNYNETHPIPLRKINPHRQQVIELLKYVNNPDWNGGGAS